MRPLQFPDLYPTTTENRDLSFFLQKIPARTRLQHPSAGYLPHPIEISPHTSHCSSHVFNTASRSMRARDGVWNIILVSGQSSGRVPKHPTRKPLLTQSTLVKG